MRGIKPTPERILGFPCFKLEFTSLSALERSEECPNGRSCFQNTTLHSGSRGDINRIQIISLGSTFSRARLRDGQTIHHSTISRLRH